MKHHKHLKLKQRIHLLKSHKKEKLQLPSIIYFHLEIPKKELNPFEIILSFFNNHHLFIKTKKLKKELLLYPSIIQYFIEYENAYKSDDPYPLLEVLLKDIQYHNELKKLESVNALFYIVNKTLKEKDPSFILEKQIKNQIENCITIGGFTLDADTIKSNADTLESLVPMISFSHLSQVEDLKIILYEIGYDKLKLYIEKQPYIEFKNLQSIVYIDRLIRNQYQTLLERVEMYFRSSFTQHISHKYDEIYEVIDKDIPYFYYRGYLRNYIFEDNDLHFRNIEKLNTRIDNEILANNQQIIDEYKECGYAIRFSTCAGLMSFGWLIGIFQNLVVQEKREFLNLYYHDIQTQSFNSWIVGLNNLRNKCAHYQSLYRLSFKKELRPIITKIEDQHHIDSMLHHDTLFYYTILAVRLSANKQYVLEFISTLEDIFKKAKEENTAFDLLLDYTFPKNWKEILLEEMCSYTIKKEN